MVVSHKMQQQAKRSERQRRDQEMRMFCELLRLIWSEQPEIRFEELLDLAYDQVYSTECDRSDNESYKLLQKLYYDGVHIGEFTPEDGAKTPTGTTDNPESVASG